VSALRLVELFSQCENLSTTNISIMVLMIWRLEIVLLRFQLVVMKVLQAICLSQMTANVYSRNKM
jgi:hypothetical protein